MKKNKRNWKGGVQKRGKDCMSVWVGVNKRKRRPVKVWEDHFGHLKAGLVIYHKDRNNKNDKIENLEAITRAEMMLRNKRKK